MSRGGGQCHTLMCLSLKLARSPPRKAGIKLLNSYIHADSTSETELQIQLLEVGDYTGLSTN